MGTTRRAAWLSALLLGLPAPATSQGQEPPSPAPIVFVHATIVDVKALHANAALKADRTVAVIGDRIVILGDRAPIPARAQVIDASGKFLVPGLWDMHVHLTDSKSLSLFVANGVTGVRDMGGAAADANNGCESLPAAALFDWRQRIRSGQWIGPELLISGPAVSGTGWPTSLAAQSADDARRAVRTLRDLGVDSIKVYDKIPLGAYQALASEARQVGLPFVGHVPVETVSVLEAVAAGQRSVEHVRDHLLMCFTEDRKALDQFFKDDHWSAADIEWGLTMHGQCPSLIAAFRTHAAWLVPTLVVERAKVAVEDPSFVADPRRALLPASVRSGFEAFVRRKQAQSQPDRRSEHLWWRTQQRLVARMHAAGVPLMAGTDSACEGGLPGYSLHEELGLLVESGLTPLEALKTATIHPARYLARADTAGSVETGKEASLVLLDANPLDDIGNTRRIHAVVSHGRLFQRHELDLLQETASRQ